MVRIGIRTYVGNRGGMLWVVWSIYSLMWIVGGDGNWKRRPTCGPMQLFWSKADCITEVIARSTGSDVHKLNNINGFQGGASVRAFGSE